MYEMKVGDTFNEMFPFKLVMGSAQITDFTGWTVTSTFVNTSTGLNNYSAAVSVNASSPQTYVTSFANTAGWVPGLYMFDFRFRNPGGTFTITSQTFSMSVVGALTP